MTALTIIQYAVPIFVFLILSEIILYRKKGLAFPYKEALLSSSIGLIYPFLNTFGAKLIGPFSMAAYELRPWTIPANTWWGLFLLFFGVEFFYYCLHRCAHEMRWL